MGSFSLPGTYNKLTAAASFLHVTGVVSVRVQHSLQSENCMID